MFNYQKAFYLTSSKNYKFLPKDLGIEIAFLGRSNAGKSTIINTLTQKKNLAKSSKTPGCTNLINLFQLDKIRRIVDFPGYGFTKSSTKKLGKYFEIYLEKRKSLKGVIIVIDVRHIQMPMDIHMVKWTVSSDLPCHIILNKSDKLNIYTRNKMLKLANSFYNKENNKIITMQLFSNKIKTIGLKKLKNILNKWYHI